jgi:CheY-like chemotaxis protein
MAKKPQILFVAGLKSFLDHKYEVSTACNGLEGLKVLEGNDWQHDLVIMDLVMPGINGVREISLLKQRSPKTPIIALTGWGQHPRELETEAKPDKVLMKPFDLEDLDQSVSNLLAAQHPEKASDVH